MRPLRGRRVLLLAPRFFGYEFEVQREIERQGAVVDLLPDRPFDSAAMTAMTRLRPQWVLPSAERIHRRLLAGFGATKYDTIFIVNGQTLSPRLRTELRTSFPTARMVLYMWDSLRNRPAMKAALPEFDAVSSFDPEDAREFGMRLRPLFFGSRFEMPPNEAFEHHVSFVGTAHTDRFAVIDRLRAGLGPGLRSYWYLFLQAPWVFHVYKLTNPGFRSARRSDFQFVALPRERVSQIFAASRAVVDIEHPRQRGLTMRTFETIGAHKKLISTNPHVRDYDFFRPQNICVIDRHAPRLPAGFLEEPGVPLPPDVYHRLSLAGWVEELLDAPRFDPAQVPTDETPLPSATPSPFAHGARTPEAAP